MTRMYVGVASLTFKSYNIVNHSSKDISLIVFLTVVSIKNKKHSMVVFVRCIPM